MLGKALAREILESQPLLTVTSERHIAALGYRTDASKQPKWAERARAGLRGKARRDGMGELRTCERVESMRETGQREVGRARDWVGKRKERKGGREGSVNACFMLGTARFKKCTSVYFDAVYIPTNLQQSHFPQQILQKSITF